MPRSNTAQEPTVPLLRFRSSPIGMEIQTMYHNKMAGTRRKMILETDRQEHNPTAVMIYAHHARLPFSGLSISYHQDAREETSKRPSHGHSV